VNKINKTKIKGTESSSIWFLLISILLLNLYFNTQYADPFNTAKLILLLITSGWLIGHVFNSIRKREIEFKSSTGAAALISIFFIAFMFVSSVFTDEKVIGFTGDQQRRLGWLTYFGFVVFFIFSAIKVKKIHETKILKLGIINQLILGVYAMFQISGRDFVAWDNPYNSIITTVGNPNFASSTLAVLSCLSLLSLLNKNISQAFKMLAIVSLILGLIAIILSNSRQGIVSLISGLLFFAAGYYYFNSNRFKYVVPSISLIAVIVGIFGMLQKGPLSDLLYKPSVTLRGYYWDAGINMFTSKPFTGIGVDSYERYFFALRSVEYPLKYGFQISSSNAHNVFIQLFATSGIVVGALYLLLMSLIFFTGLRLVKNSERSERIFALGLLSAWLAFQSQALISIDNIGLTIWGWFLGGTIIGISNKSVRSEGQQAHSKVVQIQLFQPIVSSLFLVPLIIISILLHRSETGTLNLQKVSVSGPMDETVVESLVDKVYKNPISLPQYKLYSNSILFTVNQNLAKNRLSELENKYKRLINVHYAKIEQNPGDLNIEFTYRKKISHLDPFNTKNYLRLIEICILEDNFEAMQDNYKKLLSIAPFSEDSETAKELIRKYSG
jgi:O-antigen ligase